MPNYNISRWLLICCIAVIIMIVIGGLTRLTNSGLSIVDWKPITGVIPPLDANDWQIEFIKYQESPEYKLKNMNMHIQEFKFIFWLEFIHRFFGRVVFLIYLIPLIYFILKKQIDCKELSNYVIILLLLGAQGLMGWYMVKSGLIKLPQVSHYRLAMHLILAVILYNLLFWQLMKNRLEILLLPNDINLSVIKNICFVIIMVLYGQIFLGALVAGLDAGLVYNSFPLMGNSFVPPEFSLSDIIDLLSEPAALQFMHRMGAYLLLLGVLCLFFYLRSTQIRRLRQLSIVLLSLVLLQGFLGIMTILYHVPLLIALLHQIGAVFLLSCVIWCYFLVSRKSII